MFRKGVKVRRLANEGIGFKKISPLTPCYLERDGMGFILFCESLQTGVEGDAGERDE